MSNNGTIIFIIPSKAYQITILPPENHGLRSIGLINVHLKVHESYSSTCLWSSVSSEIHQVDSDRYFGKAFFSIPLILAASILSATKESKRWISMMTPDTINRLCAFQRTSQSRRSMPRQKRRTLQIHTRFPIHIQRSCR